MTGGRLNVSLLSSLLVSVSLQLLQFLRQRTANTSASLFPESIHGDLEGLENVKGPPVPEDAATDREEAAAALAPSPEAPETESAYPSLFEDFTGANTPGSDNAEGAGPAKEATPQDEFDFFGAAAVTSPATTAANKGGGGGGGGGGGRASTADDDYYDPFSATPYSGALSSEDASGGVDSSVLDSAMETLVGYSGGVKLGAGLQGFAAASSAPTGSASNSNTPSSFTASPSNTTRASTSPIPSASSAAAARSTGERSATKSTLFSGTLHDIAGLAGISMTKPQAPKPKGPSLAELQRGSEGPQQPSVPQTQPSSSSASQRSSGTPGAGGAASGDGLASLFDGMTMQ